MGVFVLEEVASDAGDHLACVDEFAAEASDLFAAFSDAVLEAKGSSSDGAPVVAFGVPDGVVAVSPEERLARLAELAVILGIPDGEGGAPDGPSFAGLEDDGPAFVGDFDAGGCAAGEEAAKVDEEQEEQAEDSEPDADQFLRAISAGDDEGDASADQADLEEESKEPQNGCHPGGVKDDLTDGFVVVVDELELGVERGEPSDLGLDGEVIGL